MSMGTDKKKFLKLQKAPTNFVLSSKAKRIVKDQSSKKENFDNNQSTQAERHRK